MRARKFDSFSLSIANSNGTRANHAKNQISKSGNASVRSIAERIARSAFFHDGMTRAIRGNCMALVYQNTLISGFLAVNLLLLAKGDCQADRNSVEQVAYRLCPHKNCHELVDEF